jgi:hypothetical protein
MDRWIAALLAGVLGGAGGALAVRVLFPPTEGSTATTAPAQVDDARLARIEQALAGLAERGPGLTAAPRPSSGPERGGSPAFALTGPEGEAFKKALREELGTALDQHAAKVRTAGEEAGRAARGEPPGRKRMDLAEAAREMGLTADEEHGLRRIYDQSQEQFIKLAAGEGGDVEAVRKDLDEAKRDAKKRPLLFGKYLPKLLPKMGEVIQVRMDQQTQVETLLGAERAQRLERDFDVVEANPLGGGGEMRIESRMGNR